MAGTRTKPKQDKPSEVASRIRDRIVELKRVPAEALQDNERNWRTHPYAQRLALREVLDAVGIADALIAYYSERAGGKLTLIDGHLRHEDHDDVDWPVLITDLNDEEADLMLATFDPIATLAGSDGDKLSDLLDDVHTGTPALEDLMREQLSRADLTPEQMQQLEAEGGPREMELQAFEHYDYIVVLFRNALDWQQAKERLGIEKEAFTLRDGVTKRVGLGRVIDGRRFLDVLEAP